MSVDSRRSKAAAGGGTLFERLRAEDEGVRLSRGGEPLADYVGSIKRNLARILNARAGGAPSAVELGLSDFNDSAMESTNMLNHVARDIRRCVEAYEPRVSHVRVEFERERNQGGTLRFRILADVAIERRSEAITVDLALLDGRRFVLR